ncbi:MAG: hypothetical protein QXY01_07540 [Candidatus Bathyarchaeia archaeon]
MTIPKMYLGRYLSRAWFYFRTGYSTYLTFLLGAVNTLTIVYYLLVRNVPALEVVFPRFSIFAVIAVCVGVPFAVFVGWLHMKGTPAWTSEMEISVEANPYYYKLPPGHAKEVYAPLYLEVLRLVKRLAEREGLLKPEEEAEIQVLEEKMRHLIEGGYVGTPRRKTPI